MAASPRKSDVDPRAVLHRLVDGLPARELPAAKRYLALQNAPLDDEPVTPEEEAAVAVAREELVQGKGVPWERVRHRYLAPSSTKRTRRRSA